MLREVGGRRELEGESRASGQAAVKSERVFAVLNAEGISDGFYEATQTTFDADGGPITLTSPIVFTSDKAGELQEVNLTAGVPEDTIVVVSRSTNADGDPAWLFSVSSSLPAPGLETQVLQLDSSGQAVWGYVKIAPEEPA